VPLLPAELLSSQSLKTYSDYYHTVLERIFFQTLNTPINDRVKGLPKGCELIPFLNGGLFDYRPHDFYAPEEDGLSKYWNELEIPDEWFAALFAELEQYNFTIDENSPDDIEVSVDPEMLGRIFENLLAEIDPDSGETARKATGSFYTPREIVDYMAIESLVYYLNRKTSIDKEAIYPLFKSTGTAEFSAPEREKLLVALDELKILDPACGSGAFPMGVLAKITGALKILDEHGAWWKERQLRRIDNAAVRQQMQEKLDTATVEYARKIGIIQNTLYGVDIQPIAAEISKLRCFLTLIVDENVDDSKPNRGVDPLPNLEFKFITADSLLKLPEANAFAYVSSDDMERLRQLRINYLQSFGVTKARIKDKFREIQRKIYNDQAGNSILDPNSREYKISCWDPFNDEKSDWFDPEWMFGVKDGFDVVIGNPPYFVYQKERVNEIAQIRQDKTFDIAKGGKLNAYKLFMAKAINTFVSSKGIVALIFQNSFLADRSATLLRKHILKNKRIISIDSFPERDNPKKRVFENVKMSVCVVILEIGVKSSSIPLIVCYDRYMSAGHHVDLSSDDIISIDDKNYSIPSLREESLGVLKKINQGRDIVLKCYEGELNMTFHKHLFTLNPVNSIIHKGAAIQRYFITNKMSQGIKEYLDINKYNIEFGNSPKSKHYRLARIAMQGITGVDDAQRLVMTLTEPNDFLANSCNYIIPEGIDLKYLLALLNSKLINWYFKIFSTNSNVNGYEIDNLPIRQAEDFAPYITLVDQILAAKTANPATDTSVFESEIDRMVYELYGLSPEEISIIEHT
jgi:Alw26I/Eco31I/Esp3I family type II restriction m6 adenine DNA methyltransferase